MIFSELDIKNGLSLCDLKSMVEMIKPKICEIAKIFIRGQK